MCVILHQSVLTTLLGDTACSDSLLIVSEEQIAFKIEEAQHQLHDL